MYRNMTSFLKTIKKNPKQQPNQTKKTKTHKQKKTE